MKSDEYRQLLQNASKSTRWLNASAAVDCAGAITKLERAVGDATLGAAQVQATTRQRFFISVTAYRTRLLDEDNLCEKYHVDLCRYAGALPDDDPSQTKIEVRQIKAGKGEQERVEIEVWKLT